MRKGILISAAILAFGISACGALGSGSQVTAQPGGILLQDDFSDPGSGWDRTSTDDVLTDYENGEYRILVKVDNHSAWGNPNQTSYADVRVEADAHKVGGVDDNEFGLVCRHADPSNFYYVTISSDGYYGFFKYVNGELDIVGEEQLQPSDSIVLGAATNHIRLDCVSSMLALYVNGEFVAEVSDSSHANGDVGLYAGTWDTPGTDILFDNFVVYQP